MKVVTIDNNESQVLLLVDYLRDAFPDYEFLPENTDSGVRTFRTWQNVNEYLKQITDPVVILCLDLAITTKQEDYPDVDRGLDAGGVIRIMKPKWVIVAYTRYGDYATNTEEFRESFDGMIEKGKLDGAESRHDRIEYLRRVISAAYHKRVSGNAGPIFPEDLYVVDSLGMRTFRAAFGDEAIIELVETEATGWTGRKIKAMTSGYSGAFMLSIKGISSSGSQSLVLKLARSQKIIQEEMEAQTKYLGQLGPLAGHLVTIDPVRRTLLGGIGVYYRQVLIEGSQLIELIEGKEWRENERILKTIVDLCISVYKAVNLAHTPEMVARDVFLLSPIDIGTFETSARFIETFAKSLQRASFWPSEFGNPSDVTEELVTLVKNWNVSNLTNVNLKTVLQHGDLNPANVMIQKDGSPMLLDLQRMRPSWPIGYDLSRLAIMLRLRLMSVTDHEDWLPNDLTTWLSAKIGLLEDAYEVSPTLCSEAAYCDERFRAYLSDAVSPEFHKVLKYGYRLSALWDLLKVVSYRDISPFKKIWAFLQSWRLLKELEFEKSILT